MLFVQGYLIDRDDIVAISRLRSKGLARLDIPGCCVVNLDAPYWEETLSAVDDDLITEVRNLIQHHLSVNAFQLL